MAVLLDTSVLLASLHAGEPRHRASATLVEQGGHLVYVHALAELFSTLTGGRIEPRVAPDLAEQLLRESILPHVKSVTIGERDLMSALRDAHARGVRGGAVYDYLHLVAARKAGAEALVTLDERHFRAIARPGDPAILEP